MSDHQHDFLVVGAGVCGLTVAERLAADGKKVVVVEREPEIGGLARTFVYPEGRFDIGPHRFHTTDNQVLTYLDEVLAEDGLRIPRTSLVYFLNHYYRWPIHPSLNLLRLPWRLIFGIGMDLLFFLYRKKTPDTFEDYILNMYGQTLYRTFFRDYTTKFLGINPAETHADWAKTGIDRAIIDERLHINTLSELIKSLLVRPKGAETLFRYPLGGVDRFARKLHERIAANGGKVLCNEEVVSMDVADGQIRSIGTRSANWQPRQVIWTASLPALLSMAGLHSPSLRYLDLVCYNLVTTVKRGPDFQWCYFGSPDLVFSRVSRPEAFDPGMIPTGHGGLCVEVTAGLASDIWINPQSHLGEVLDGLGKVGLIGSKREIEAVHIERIREAYPIYAIGYDQHLRQAMEKAKGLRNLHLAGRTGTFWYNNMDHSIASALELFEKAKSC